MPALCGSFPIQTSQEENGRVRGVDIGAATAVDSVCGWKIQKNLFTLRVRKLFIGGLLVDGTIR